MWCGLYIVLFLCIFQSACKRTVSAGQAIKARNTFAGESVDFIRTCSTISAWTADAFVHVCNNRVPVEPLINCRCRYNEQVGTIHLLGRLTNSAFTKNPSYIQLRNNE